MNEIICLGKTDNGVQREERYCAKSRHGQARHKALQHHPKYVAIIANVGSKQTVDGVKRCVEVWIKGKLVPESVESYSTCDVPPVKMFNGGMA